MSDIIIISVTKQGTRLAVRLADVLGSDVSVPVKYSAEASGARLYSSPVVEEVRMCWAYRKLILVMPAGVAVRAIAPLLQDKHSDPAVVCLDEAGRSIIPLLGGHQAGANDLARRIAPFTGGHAAVTTASDVQHKPALDLLGDRRWHIDPGSALTHASARLVNEDCVGVYVEPVLQAHCRSDLETLWPLDNVVPVCTLEALGDPAYKAGLIVSHRTLPIEHTHLLSKCVLYRPRVLVAGIGCRRGVAADDLYANLLETCTLSGLSADSLKMLASVDIKHDEAGLAELATRLQLPLVLIGRDKLQDLDSRAFSPSAAQDRLGIPGVAEPCAVLAGGGGELLVPKRVFAASTVAIALACPTEPAQPVAVTAPADGILSLVSIGPGDIAQMTVAARDILCSAEVVVGYRPYIEMVRSLLKPGQEIVIGAMGNENERAEQAIVLATAGKRVALISSGDIGIYAMAGFVFELLKKRDWQGANPPVEVLPGVSAMQAAAARLGAPISHDFCAISLSDLLTAWDAIERRLWAAAEADFVIALYNPRSKGRDWQLSRAVEILRKYRAPATPVAIARNVTRPDESIKLTTLAELDVNEVDMWTLLLIGNTRSYAFAGHMGTPRSYPESAFGYEAALISSPGIDADSVYPVMLTHMQHLSTVVVGGGAVGERKVRYLLVTGAQVRLISPHATPQLEAWARDGRIRWDQRPYQAGDCASVRLVFAATDEREVNACIAGEAKRAGALCNVADDPDACDFHVPAVHRTDHCVIAVGSRGVNPATAQRMRDRIAELLA